MKKSLSVFLFIISLNLGCDKIKINNELNPLERYFFLSAEYSNKTGIGAKISIDTISTSKAININSNSAITDSLSQIGRIKINFNNIIFKDALGLYKVDDIVTEENIDGKWEGDSENFLKEKSVSQISVALVLDMSSSLGTNRIRVQDEAINFVNIVKRNIPNSRFIIIGFAQELKIYNNLTDINDITQKIRTLPDFIPNQDATALYAAMQEGYDKLSLTSGLTKVLVSFTDGKNNYNGDINLLNNSIKTGNISSSHVIGLRGKDGLDVVLKDLTFNGYYLETENSNDLSVIFDRIANSVVSIYTLTYDRNNSKQETPIKLRFKIRTHLI